MTGLRGAVSKALIEQGFRHQGRMHRLPIDAGFSFWVDTGPLGKRDDIAPFVGLRSEEVEALVSSFLGLPLDAWVGTVGANIGYVLGREYSSWESPTPVSEVLATIKEGLERLRPFASRGALAGAWDLVGKEDPSYWYRRLVVARLTQDPPHHLARLASLAEADLCSTQDEVCEEFTRFKGALMNWSGVVT